MVMNFFFKNYDNDHKNVLNKKWPFSGRGTAHCPDPSPVGGTPPWYLRCLEPRTFGAHSPIPLAKS